MRGEYNGAGWVTRSRLLQQWQHGLCLPCKSVAASPVNEIPTGRQHFGDQSLEISGLQAAGGEFSPVLQRLCNVSILVGQFEQFIGKRGGIKSMQKIM